MSALTHDAEGRRFELLIDDERGRGLVWADYAREPGRLAVLHVEAEPQLRNTGAAGQFMQALVDTAREERTQLRPVCGYAVMWLRRHPDSADVVWKG